MKMRKLSLLLLFCSFAMATMATSTPSGDKEKSSRMEVAPGMAAPSSSTLQGVISDEMLAAETIAETAETTTETPSPVVADAPVPTERVVHFDNAKKQKRFDKKVEKIKNKIARKQGGTPIVPLLALIFGIVGFLVAFVFFPIGLLFGLTAIILGAIGMGKGEGRGMAIVGLIMGILTILIPVLLIALVLAILL